MFFEQWSQECLETLTLKPSTRYGYESLLACHIVPAFGSAELSDISTMAVQRWVVQMGNKLSASRTRQAYVVLSSMLGMAVTYGELDKTPCTRIKLPRLPKHERSFLTPEQVRALADTSGHYRPFILFLAYTGLRWGEATAVRRRDIDGNRVTVARGCAEVNGTLIYGTPKSHHKRTVVMADSLAVELAPLLRGLAPDDLVFVTKRGMAMRVGNYRRQYWLPAINRAGLPTSVTIHTLRHTCAAMMVSQNVPPKAIQRILGHSSITVTLDIYGHLYESALDDAAEALNAIWA